jgi:hypothetical protein
MSFRFRGALLVLALLAPALSASAQDWSFAFSGFVFDPPEESSYFSPIFYADRGALHLEGRFNYEDRDTASVFIGRNFETGEEVTFTAVPMFGVVFGSTTGVAPGAEIEIGWRRLALYSETEYVFDLDANEESHDSFLYTWGEVTISLTDWLRAGLVVQRTRTYESGLDLQRGLLVELSRGSLSFGFHWFNPDRSEDQVFAYAIGYEF